MLCRRIELKMGMFFVCSWGGFVVVVFEEEGLVGSMKDWLEFHCV